MKIDQDKCTACLNCLDYCPVGAIAQDLDSGHVIMDEASCVECGCCLRGEVCEWQAIWQQELEWPRRLRAEFSDPLRPHPSTDEEGRGTQEMKTNEVTGRYPVGTVGIAAELGRPGIGASLRDVQKVVMALASLGVDLEQNNPVYPLVEDHSTGKFKEDVLNEKVLSAIVEVNVELDRMPVVLRALADVSKQLDTVFSVDLCSLLSPDGTSPAEVLARECGFQIRPNGKNNVGLGRPLASIWQGGMQ